ncbi:MAG: hypothetical protein EZS28_008347 [Streblomastix strix]|uniref:Uncharacterized protein n=1 Tax=Streblomastix strix TaxID=222440 RepID=A0A5J4WNX7_9EUKA|nr:MAG: hypothetical protein EZS28_008347 [Streblomastix strix]
MICASPPVWAGIRRYANTRKKLDNALLCYYRQSLLQLLEIFDLQAIKRQLTIPNLLAACAFLSVDICLVLMNARGTTNAAAQTNSALALALPGVFAETELLVLIYWPPRKLARLLDYRLYKLPPV